MQVGSATRIFPLKFLSSIPNIISYNTGCHTSSMLISLFAHTSNHSSLPPSRLLYTDFTSTAFRHYCFSLHIRRKPTTIYSLSLSRTYPLLLNSHRVVPNSIWPSHQCTANRFTFAFSLEIKRKIPKNVWSQRSFMYMCLSPLRAYRELSGGTSVFHAFLQQRWVPVRTRGNFAQQQPVMNTMSERFAQCRRNFRFFFVHHSRQVVG